MESTSGAAEAASASADIKQEPRAASAEKDIAVITNDEGEAIGLSLGPALQLTSMVTKLLASPRLVALPISGRYALAGRVAAAPAEHAGLVERLACHAATAPDEISALNALYLLDVCKELVPGFAARIPAERLQKAAELSPYARVKAALLDETPPAEWEAARNARDSSSVFFFDQGDEYGGILSDAGRTIGDMTKTVGGAALGGVGHVTDKLGLTEQAEAKFAVRAHDAVDAIVDGFDGGFDDTVSDVDRKGVTGAVRDGVADAVDIVADFVGDAVHGIAGGVREALDWVTQDRKVDQRSRTHTVAIIVTELIGEERSLGLRIESRVLTAFTKPEAKRVGWKLGDCIIGVGDNATLSQESLLECIAASKDSLRLTGAPMRFLVERLGPDPDVTKTRESSVASTVD